MLLTIVVLFFNACKKDMSFQLDQDSPITQQQKTSLTLDLENRNYSSLAVETIFSPKHPNDLVADTRDELSLESQIANQILFEIESEVPFIEDFLTEYGVPYWEYAFSNKNSEIFNVSIPIIKEDSITSTFSFLQVDDMAVSFHFRTVEFNTSLLPYDTSFTNRYIHHVFQNLTITSGKVLQNAASFRNECCPTLSVPTYATLQGSTWTFSLNSGSFCICYDWLNDVPDGAGGNGLINMSCCENGGSGNQLDGGAYEAGIDGTSPTDFGTFNDWLIYYSHWLNYWNEQNGRPSNGTTVTTNNNNHSNVQILNFIQNEQKLLGWLVGNFLEPNFGIPTPFEYVNLLGDNPHIAGEIYKYLQGFYDEVPVIEQDAVDLFNLMVSHSNLFLSNLEIQQILTFEPTIIEDVQNFLDDHPNDAITIQAIHDFLALQHCNFDAPCNHVNYPNELELIYDFYQQLSQEEYDWLHSTGIVAVLGQNVGTTVHEEIMAELILNNEQDLLNLYIDLMVEGEIDMPLDHFKHLHDFNALGYDLPYAVLAAIVNESECITSGDFNNCAKEQLLNHLNGFFSFTNDELTYLNTNFELTAQLIRFIEMNSGLEFIEFALIETLAFIWDETGELSVINDSGVALEYEYNEDDIPSTEGWLSCKSFDSFGTPDGWPTLLTAGVDGLNHSWAYMGGTGTTGLFDIDVRINQFNNGQVILDDDAAFCTSKAANYASRVVGLTLGLLPVVNSTTVKNSFLINFNIALTSGNIISSSCTDVSGNVLEGDYLPNRKNVEYYSSFIIWWYNCGL